MVKGIENIATRKDLVGFENSVVSELRKAQASFLRWMFFFQITQALLIWTVFYYFQK